MRTLLALTALSLVPQAVLAQKYDASTNRTEYTVELYDPTKIILSGSGETPECVDSAKVRFLDNHPRHTSTHPLATMAGFILRIDTAEYNVKLRKHENVVQQEWLIGNLPLFVVHQLRSADLQKFIYQIDFFDQHVLNYPVTNNRGMRDRWRRVPPVCTLY